jgi:hypothetical protein
MNELQETRVHRTEPMRPEDIQEMFGIKKVAYYNRLKFLGMEAYKDEDGKPYLDEAQVALLEKLDDYIKLNGKMEGFDGNNGGASLIKAGDSNGIESTNGNGKHSTPDIYVEPEEPTEQFDINQLLRDAANLKARDLAMRDLITRKLADNMTEEDLPEDLREKVNLAREAANPKYTPQEVAQTLLTQWRAKRSSGS